VGHATGSHVSRVSVSAAVTRGSPLSRLGLVLVAFVVVVAAVVVGAVQFGDRHVPAVDPSEGAAPPDPPVATPEAEPVVVETPETPWHPLVDRRSVGQPWGEVAGLTTFRGNPTRTYYGEGPVPTSPEVLWRYPDQVMCTTERLSSGAERRWCGTGWTGQPLVHEDANGDEEAGGRPDSAAEGGHGRSRHAVWPALQAWCQHSATSRIRSMSRARVTCGARRIKCRRYHPRL
jgi:hypothetical protein